MVKKLSLRMVIFDKIFVENFDGHPEAALFDKVIYNCEVVITVVFSGNYNLWFLYSKNHSEIWNFNAQGHSLESKPNNKPILQH